MRSKLIFGIAVLTAMFSITGVTAATATPGVSSEFATQGQTAGLTATQINTLQAEADEYLTQLGGKQVSLNQVEIEGATIRIALPGEAQPRQLTAAEALDVNCDGGFADYRHFCAYRGQNFTGTHIDMYTCRVYDIPESWVGPGSWDNNQTTGTVAEMMNDAGTVIFRTAAPDWDASGSWTPVDRMRNC
jgi:hypothetical protein